MTKISDIGIENTIKLLLPHLVTAGQLALRLQPQIASGEVSLPAQKSGARFSAALTDADVLVESLIGSMIFLLLEDATFDGEEAQLDRISKFFPHEAPFTIRLDPVNGTLLYKSGTPLFDIILSVWQGGTLLAAIDYVPAIGRCFIGIRNQGAFELTENDILSYRPWQPLVLRPKNNRILTHRASDATLRKLREADFTPLPLEDFVEDEPWDTAGFSLLTGDIAGFTKQDANRIDWGAIAFIASLAGGAWNNPIFGVDGRAKTAITAGTPELYEKLVVALS